LILDKLKKYKSNTVYLYTCHVKIRETTNLQSAIFANHY